MAAHLRPPKSTPLSFPRLPHGLPALVVGVACAILLGGAIAAFALAVAGPPVRQPVAPPVLTTAPPVLTTAPQARTLANTQPNALLVDPSPAGNAPTQSQMSVSDDGTLAMGVEFVP